MFKEFILLICTVLFLSNCRKNNYATIPADMGHSFLPLMIGSEYIYKADSIKYGFNGTKLDGDTISFYLKDVVTYKIQDSSKTTYTLSRYHSKDTLNWVFIKNHFYEVEKLRINHKENNLITTPLVFPIEKYYYWNGNELNNLNPKEYEYSIVDFDLKLNLFHFPNSLKVKMDSTDNLRERKIESEFFSKNIGLVYLERINVSLINNDSLDNNGNIVISRPPKIEKGVVFTKKLIKRK
jgi:hypothetical protein